MSNRQYNHYFGKTNVFFQWKLLIILFADGRAKKYGSAHLCSSGKEKYISGTADFGAAGLRGHDFHTQPDTSLLMCTKFEI